MRETYVELGMQSAFSFLRASALPEDLAARAAALELGAFALSDFGGVYGAPRLHQAARKAGVRALVGASVTVSDIGNVRLLCETRAGYKNLCRLLTLGHRDRSKGTCEVALCTLAEHARDLTCLAGPGLQGDLLAQLVLLRQCFSAAHLAVELHRHLDRREEQRCLRLAEAARAAALPSVATNDVRHVLPEHKALTDLLTCIRERTPRALAGRRLLPNAEWHLKSPRQMQALFADQPEAVRESVRIAERCTFGLEALGYRFPDFPVPSGSTPIAMLRELTYAGARERYRPLGEAARRQLERELVLIEKLKLEGYFLIVWDIVRMARAERIMVQGRGSAANSAVCYSLGITAVDPIGMDLLFERFLSEERGEWPDIDLDLPSGQQRERVIQYVYGKYGVASAAMTANVISFRDKSALREVGRALGFGAEEIERVATVCGSWSSLDDVELFDERLAQAGLDKAAPRVREWMGLARQVLHLPRHLGQHSGGMVIAAGRLDEIVPLEPASMPGRVVIQWDKDDCADLGIIKVDLLGLGMLHALEEAVPLIKQSCGVDIDYARLPADDPKVYDMICRADTVGVFQIESRAQMATLPRLKPRRFYDLVIEVALIRPGPIVGQMVHPFLARRAGREKVVYAHPSLEPILSRTLGVPLFQEQLMRMAMAVAGFTGGEAEELRRAMGFKRSVERMHEIEARLRAGMQTRGIGQAAQDEIVRSITSFALYGFPESHSASFALIAYASAYLKAYYPAAFLCALLNAWPMGFYHPSTLIKDAQRHGVHVAAIDVTRSTWACTLDEPNTVRLGLCFVRGLSASVGQAIVTERRSGPFLSIHDLERRCTLAQTELDTLAELGALAAFGQSRRQALWQVAGLPERSFGLLAQIEPDAARRDAHDDAHEASPLAEMTLPERVAADFRGSAMSVGPHPMHFLRASLARDGIASAADLTRAPDGSAVRVAGLVRVRQRPGTARGFFFVTLEDETGFANLIVKPDLFEAERAVWVGAGGFVAAGRVQHQDDVVSLKCTAVRDLAAAYPKGAAEAPEFAHSRYG